MAVHTETLTNASTSSPRFCYAGGRYSAVVASGSPTCTLQMEEGSSWINVQDNGEDIAATSGSIAGGIAVSGVYRWNQTGTASTSVTLRTGATG